MSGIDFLRFENLIARLGIEKCTEREIQKSGRRENLSILWEILMNYDLKGKRFLLRK